MTDFDFNSSFRHVTLIGNFTPYLTDEDEPASDQVSIEVVLLACIYTVVFGVGLFGNGSLLIALLSQQSMRSKNPLLIGLCFADLLVCACSGPLTAARPEGKEQDCDSILCITLTCLEGFPVSASTLSLMMLSVDRYATVHHSRALPYLQKRPHLVVFIIWTFAALFTLPFLAAKSIELDFMCDHDCVFDVRIASVVCYVIFVLVIPILTMLTCHLSVRAKLCALSLTARAAHGELPLPMPLLRRPTHMIIVAGMPNAQTQSVKYQCEPEEKDFRRSRKQPSGGPQRGSSVRKSIKVEGPAKPSLLTTQPQTSTLQSRRRLGNVLVSVAAVFAGCWFPHAIACLYGEFQKNFPKYLLQYSLLLGHAHSAINPVVYWALNHNALRQHICCPCPRASRFLFHLKFHDDQPPSSTNEAALGPFHPRYMRARPVIERAAPSSHYLY